MTKNKDKSIAKYLINTLDGLINHWPNLSIKLGIFTTIELKFVMKNNMN